jgi:hypothetical protein
VIPVQLESPTCSTAPGLSFHFAAGSTFACDETHRRLGRPRSERCGPIPRQTHRQDRKNLIRLRQQPLTPTGSRRWGSFLALIANWNVTGITALRSRRKHHACGLPHRERAMRRAIVGTVLCLAVAASVFVELSTYAEIVSMAPFADASIDAGPAF